MLILSVLTLCSSLSILTINILQLLTMRKKVSTSLNVTDKHLRKLVVYFLKQMAIEDPEYFDKYVKKFTDKEEWVEILNLRYKQQLKFEVIPDFLPRRKTLRSVFDVHNKFITEILIHSEI